MHPRTSVADSGSGDLNSVHVIRNLCFASSGRPANATLAGITAFVRNLGPKPISSQLTYSCNWRNNAPDGKGEGSETQHVYHSRTAARHYKPHKQSDTGLVGAESTRGSVPVPEKSAE